MSPFIDDRGRLFGRVSVVDIIVVLLIVAVGAFAWGRFSSDEAKMKGYRMVLYVEKTRDPAVTESNVGDKVRDDTGAALGRIETLAPPPPPPEFPPGTGTPTDVPTANGNLELKRSKVFQEIFITVKGQGQVSGPVGAETVLVGGTVLRKGMSLTLVGPGGDHSYEVKTIIGPLELAK